MKKQSRFSDSLTSHQALLRVFFPAAFSILLAAAPMVVMAASQVVLWQGENDQQVTLEDRDRQGTNRHPAKISQRALARFLAGLYVGRKNEGVVRRRSGEPLFSELKAIELARLLSEALSKAAPNQDVLFRINNTDKVFGGVLGVLVSNNGRVFVDRRGYLNIIFGDIRETYSERWVFGRKVGRIGKPRDGSRRHASRSDYQILPATAVRFAKTASGKRRKDWIIFDPNVTSGVGAKTRNAQPSGSVPTEGHLEDRLRRLKRLRTSGLISEEIYRFEVKRLLENL